jgi:hypothetical protein
MQVRKGARNLITQGVVKLFLCLGKLDENYFQWEAV